MIIDATVDYKLKKLILLDSNGNLHFLDPIFPYFYALFDSLDKARAWVRLYGRNQSIKIKYTDYRPVIMKGSKYVVEKNGVVLKIYTESPSDIPEINESLRKLGVKTSGFNIRYIVRNCYDYNVRFTGTKPIFIGFDDNIVKNLSKITYGVVDVEAEGNKPIVASFYKKRLFNEIVKDDVETFILPKQGDELVKAIYSVPIIVGHNIKGYDFPLLQGAGYNLKLYPGFKLDTVEALNNYGSAFGVGAIRDLYSIARLLKDEANITDKELELKGKIKGEIRGLPLETIVEYNKNDVVITSKIADIILSFLLAVSGMFQIPVSEVVELPPGLIAEYTVFRDMELKGYIGEYRPVEASLRGERVYCSGNFREYTNILHLDIKAMYPSFVLAHNIDPTYHVEGDIYDPALGEGFLIKVVKRLYDYRQFTKSMKKQDPRWKPIDSGLKAILNAMAYGFQAKQSGMALLGNPWCPSSIFYGTLKVQYDTISMLRQLGYKVVYGDTDSFFILLEDKKPEEITQKVNEILSKWGLEADIEEIWDYLFIYSKKNYIARKGDKILIKGGAIKSLFRGFLPECIDPYELFSINDKKERLEYIYSQIDKASLRELFIHSTQQVWRLIGKSIQDLKRHKEKMNEYLRVYTPWEEPRILYLKRIVPGHLTMYHSTPLLTLFIRMGEDISLELLTPYLVAETWFLRPEFPIKNLAAKYGSFNALVYDDKIYVMKIQDIQYGIFTGKKLVYIKGQYNLKLPRFTRWFIKTVRIIGSYKPVSIDKDLLKNLVRQYTIRKLRDYRLI